MISIEQGPSVFIETVLKNNQTLLLGNNNFIFHKHHHCTQNRCSNHWNNSSLLFKHLATTKTHLNRYIYKNREKRSRRCLTSIVRFLILDLLKNLKSFNFDSYIQLKNLLVLSFLLASPLKQTADLTYLLKRYRNGWQARQMRINSADTNLTVSYKNFYWYPPKFSRDNE